MHLWDNNVEHLIGNVFNFIWACLQFHPSQDFLLLFEVSFVDGRNSFLEIQKLRELFNSIFFGFLSIIDFHESDSKLVAFIVDVLQFGENLVGLLVVVVVWNSEDNWKLSNLWWDWISKAFERSLNVFKLSKAFSLWTNLKSLRKLFQKDWEEYFLKAHRSTERNWILKA